MKTAYQKYIETTISQYEPTIALRSLRLCYLDNEPTHLQELSQSIPAGTFQELYTTTDPREAINLVKEDKIDVLISDFRMPEKDGIQLLKYCRTENPRIHLMLYSGFTLSPQDILTCEENNISRVPKIDSIASLVANISLLANAVQNFDSNSFSDQIHHEKVKPIIPPNPHKKPPVALVPAPAEESQQILREMAQELIDTYKKIKNSDQAVIFMGPNEKITVGDLIQDLETLTPRGLEHLKLWLQSNSFVKRELDKKNLK